MMYELPALRGRVSYNTLQDLETTGTWQELRARQDLQEDLLQVEYPNGLVLDVGWYQSAARSETISSKGAGGAFRILAVRENNWSDPILSIYARDFNELTRGILLADEWIAGIDS
jgi:hypothetical protein